MPRYVVTGAPGTGKTTVVSLLAGQFATVDEPARGLLRRYAVDGGGPNPLDREPHRFLRLLVEQSIRDFNSVTDSTVAFFDRGLPDCAAYAAVYGLDPGPLLERAAADFRYDSPVFIAPPWQKIYTQDALRRATFAQVEAFHLHLRSAYLELGYELVELPMASAEGRASVIIRQLHLPTDAGI